MADNTIVVAHLSDDALKNSINSLVNEVDKATKTMAENFNAQVKSMEDRIRSLGTIKVDSGGASDGGSSRRAASLNKEAQSIKEVTMSYDELRLAIKMAERQVSLYAGKNPLSLSREEIDRYAASLLKLTELQGQISNAALAKAMEAERKSTFDARSTVRDLFSTDERLKQLNRYYSQLEKVDQKRIAQEERQEAAAQKASAREVAEASKIADAWRVTEEEKRRQMNAAWIEREKQLQKEERAIATAIEKEMAANEKAAQQARQQAFNSAEQKIKEEERAATARAKANEKATAEEIRQREEALKAAHKASARQLREDFQSALTMPSATIQDLQAKADKLRDTLSQTRGTTILTPQQQSKGELLLSNLEQQLKVRQQLLSTYDEEIRRMAQLIRESEEYKKNKTFSIQHPFSIGGGLAGTSYISDESRKNALPIEEQLLQIRTIQTQQLKHAVEHNQQITWQDGQQVQLVNQQVEVEQRAAFAAREKAKAEAEAAQQAQAAQQAIQQQATSQQTATPQVSPTYKTLREEIAEVLNVQAKEVQIADTEKASYDRLSASLSQLQSAYNKLNAEQRNGDLGTRIADQMQIIQNAMKQIQSQSGRVEKLQYALTLPEGKLEDITYKIQMLRTYAQGINVDTQAGQEEVRKVGDEVDKLTQKAKDLQKTTKQIQSEANATKFEKISAMPQDNYDAIMRKTREMYNLLKELRSQPILDEKGIKRAESALAKLWQNLNKLNQTRGTTANVNSAMSMTANTLDEIAKKMQRLQAIRANLNISKQKDEIERVNKALQTLSKKQDEVMQKSTTQKEMNNALARSWNYMKNRLAFYFTVGASTQFIKTLVEIRSQYEMTERALGILVQSAERGSQIFNELSQMALVSPYTLIELSNAAKQLTAYGVAASEVVDTTRRMGDMAAAVGIPMERLTYALGQIKAYGYLNSRDARMFLNAGIPLVQELANHYTKLEGRLVSVADVYDRIKKKAVGYNDVMQVVNEMTDENGRFFDFQAKMAETLKVQLANLTLAWNNMLNDIGRSTQGVLSTTIVALKDLFLSWKTVQNTLYTLVAALGVYRISMVVAAAKTQSMSKAQILAALTSQKLVNALRAVRNALTQIAAHPIVLAVTLIVSALIQLGFEAWDANIAVKELNKAIADGAKESVKAIDELVQSYEKLGVAARAAKGLIAEDEAKKVIEQLKEAFDLYSASAGANIRDFLFEQDENKQIVKAIEGLRKVKQTAEALSDVFDEIKISSDWLWGAFGEGLAEDVEDYVEGVERIQRIINGRSSWWDRFVEGGVPAIFSEEEAKKAANRSFANVENYKEAKEEIETFAKDAATIIREKLGEGASDPTMVREAVSRLVKHVEAANPQIRGAGKTLFESVVDQTMSAEFNGVYSAIDTLWEKVLQDTKAKRGSVFQTMTEEILDETQAIPKSYTDAISKTISDMLSSNEIPLATKELLKQLQSQLDSNPLIVRVGLAQTFSTQMLDAIQRDFQKHFYPMNKVEAEDVQEERRAKYQRLNKKQGESWVEWEKRLQEELKNTNEALEARKNVLASGKYNDVQAEEARKDIEALSKQRDVLLEVIHYERMREQSDKGAKKDVLGEAISKEIQLVGEMQKRYKEYRKMGVDAKTAVKLATDEYRKSLIKVNEQLRRFGLPTLSNDQIANMALQDIRDFYKRQLGELSDVVKKVQSITYDASKEEKSEIDGVSKKLVEQMKLFEGFVGSVYEDEAGVKTIGYGHSSKAPSIKDNPIIEGLTWTKEEAHRVMMEDLKLIKQDVDAVISEYAKAYEPLKTLTASQYEALIDFTYQYGKGGLQRLLSYAQNDITKLATAIGDTTLFGINNWAGNARREWRKAMIEGRETTVDSTIRQEVESLIESGKGVEALEKAIASINVEIKKIDYKTITEGLNNELSKLKNEYELAVELDANPELGNIFADMMGISEEDIAQLPRDAAAVAKKAQEIIQRELRDGNLTSLADTFDISQLENIGKLNEWLEQAQIEKDSDLYKGIRGWVDFVNKIRLDETKKQIEQWDKLLEKYAEYETKRKRIMEEAERERNIATQKGASQEIIDAINNREKRELAQLDFEEFQKSPEWITATGDLAGLTDKALGMLIKDLEEYKKKAKNLDPKQIKQLNKALSSLYKQQRSGNPFHAIADAMDEAKMRAADYQVEIEKIEEEIATYDEKRKESVELSEEEEAKYSDLKDRLKKLNEEKEEVGKVSASSIVSGINEAIAVAAQATQQFEAMADALGGKNMTKAKEVIHGVMQNLQAAGQGAQIGAAFGGYGAAIGAIVGGLMDGVTQLASKWSGDKDITKKVQSSERAVKRLENAYKNLEKEVEQAYGTSIIGAKQLARANKELQLAELERQLELEKSRKSKNRDEDRIIELEGQIIDLRNEINSVTEDIVNDLLGISSVGDAVENMVQQMIDAFRQGESGIDSFNESIDDMIINLIKKFAATYILGPKFQAVFDEIQKDIDKRTKPLATKLQTLEKYYEEYEDLPKYIKKLLPNKRNLKQEIEAAREAYNKASQMTIDDLYKYGTLLNGLKAEGEEVEEALNGLLEYLGYSYGDKADKQLSALQQGIKGITEDTAGAIEGYMNGVSQQVYYHSDLLTQIRDTVIGFDIDIQTATMGQMLLQLQQSYQVQMSIQNILAGVLNPSGRAFNVEMV